MQARIESSNAELEVKSSSGPSRRYNDGVPEGQKPSWRGIEQRRVDRRLRGFGPCVRDEHSWWHQPPFHRLGVSRVLDQTNRQGEKPGAIDRFKRWPEINSWTLGVQQGFHCEAPTGAVLQLVTRWLLPKPGCGPSSSRLRPCRACQGLAVCGVGTSRCPLDAAICSRWLLTPVPAPAVLASRGKTRSRGWRPARILPCKPWASSPQSSGS